MWGASAARHLADKGLSIGVIGAAEPDDHARHQGVFASHYDMGRITRRLDPKPDWCRFATRAMARYPELEKASGKQFHHAVGCVLAGGTEGAHSGYINDTIAAAEARHISHERLSGAALADRFPYFSFPSNITALVEYGGAGYVNPRTFVASEIALATARGVTFIKNQAAEIDADGTVTCIDGTRFEADQVIVAGGAFTGAAGLLPEPVPLTTYARTIALFRVTETEAATLANMPSLIYVAADGSFDIYLLPPIRYPDGSLYIKIGGDPIDVKLESQARLIEWFNGNGDANVVAHLTDVLHKVMPDLTYESIQSKSCATCYTPSGNPLIYRQSDRVTVLAGGNGAGAKGADEIGRLGALMALGENLANEDYEGGFGP